MRFDPRENVIGASPNCFLEFSPFVAYRFFPQFWQRGGTLLDTSETRSQLASAPGVGVLDFMKRISILRLDADTLAMLGPAAIALGEAEGLDAHARSVAMRLNRR